MKRAFITGITGQDGSYLAELLLDRNYEVHGLVRRPDDSLRSSRIGHLIGEEGIHRKRLHLYQGDLLDGESLRHALEQSLPQEVYHLASESHVGQSFQRIEQSANVNGLGTTRLLEVVRSLREPPRLFHASSSEVFGRPTTAPQTEATCFRPVTPYGCSKAFASHLVTVYRRDFGLFTCNGILYNHESPRRGENFVTQKICLAAARIRQGLQSDLVMGSTTAERDWGDARDVVSGMWLALQQDQPDDYIFATGKRHTVQDWLSLAFEAVGLDYREHVKQDPALMRPHEPSNLVGNPEKAERVLGWKRERSFEELVREMTEAALSRR